MSVAGTLSNQPTNSREQNLLKYKASLVELESLRFETVRPGFDPRFSCRSLSGSSHTSDLHAGTVAALPGVWRYGISTKAGWLGVGIL